MRTLLATALLLAAAAPAAAASPANIARYESTTMSCAEIQNHIREEGAVVLRYRSPNQGMPRFQRYVSGIQNCTTDELAAHTSVPASDTKSCSVKMCIDAR
jgi:hypothetical protein